MGESEDVKVIRKFIKTNIFIVVRKSTLLRIWRSVSRKTCYLVLR